MNALLLALLLLGQGPAGTISGRVLNADGTPAAGVRVAMQSIADSSAAVLVENLALTDSDGRYRCLVLTAGWLD